MYAQKQTQYTQTSFIIYVFLSSLLLLLSSPFFLFLSFFLLYVIFVVVAREFVFIFYFFFSFRSSFIYRIPQLIEEAPARVLYTHIFLGFNFFRVLFLFLNCFLFHPHLLFTLWDNKIQSVSQSANQPTSIDIRFHRYWLSPNHHTTPHHTTPHMCTHCA